MALNNFIPTVWSARILQNLQKALVFGSDAVINTDFEGEIRQMGDTVVINSIGAVTVSNYTKNTNLSDPETLSDGSMNLLINQAKSFNFQVDDIDKAQAKPKVIDEAMREAGYALADALDQYIAASTPMWPPRILSARLPAPRRTWRRPASPTSIWWNWRPSSMKTTCPACAAL